MTKATEWQEPAWLTYCSHEAMRRSGKALVRHGITWIGLSAMLSGLFYAVDGEWLIYGLAMTIALGSFGHDVYGYTGMRRRLRDGVFGSRTKEAKMIDAVLLEAQKKAGIGGPETATGRFFRNVLGQTPLQHKTIRQLAEDTIWMYEHWEQLSKIYPGQVVAVHNGAIVAAAPSHGHLNLELKALGFRVADVARQHIVADATFVKSFVALRPGRIEGLRSGDISP